MNITIDKTVSYDVSKVVISNIMINKTGNNLLFMIPFSWVDAQGKMLNQSMKRYTSTELIQLAAGLGLDFAPFITMLNTILSANKVSLRLDLRDQTSIKATIIQRRDDGKYLTLDLDTAALTVAIAPITIEQLVQVIQIISNTLTA